MRTTKLFLRLWLCLYIGLSGLLLLLAHNVRGQAMDGAEYKEAMGQAIARGNPQAMTHGQGRAAGRATEKGEKQSMMANPKGQAMGHGSSQGMPDPQPEVKGARDPQAPSNTKDQGLMSSGQSIRRSKDQDVNRSKAGHNSGHGGNGRSSDQNQGGVEVLQVSGAQSLNQILTRAEAAVQTLHVGDTNQAHSLVGAPPPNDAVVPVAPPPNNAVVQGGMPSDTGNTQQSNAGRAGNRSTNAQAANNASTNPVLASNSALFFGIASAISATRGAGIAVAMSAPMTAGTGSAGAGTCNYCQCNCPMAAFHMAQQVAMMAAMATAPPSQSTPQTIASANPAQANASTTSQQSLAAPIRSIQGPQTSPLAMATPPPGPPVEQGQANQAPKVASPQAQGVTAAGAASALPTDLSTFQFQSAVTVPLGKRREARATVAHR